MGTHAQILSCWHERNETIDQHYKNASQPERRLDWQKTGYQRFFEGNRVNDASYRKRRLAQSPKDAKPRNYAGFVVVPALPIIMHNIPTKLEIRKTKCHGSYSKVPKRVPIRGERMRSVKKTFPHDQIYLHARHSRRLGSMSRRSSRNRKFTKRASAGGYRTAIGHMVVA